MTMETGVWKRRRSSRPASCSSGVSSSVQAPASSHRHLRARDLRLLHGVDVLRLRRARGKPQARVHDDL